MSRTTLLSAAILLVCLANVWAGDIQPVPAQPTDPAATGAIAPANPLCREWTFTGSRSFDVESGRTGKQAADKLVLGCDQKATFVMDGQVRNGTWTMDKKRSAILLAVDGSKERLQLRIGSNEGNKLTVLYQDPDDLVRYELYYESKEP